MKLALTLTGALSALAAVAASPLDDCLWSMRPYDKNDDGVAQAGELIDLLTAGDLTKATHQSPCYGHNVNNAITTRTGCTTRFFTNATIPVYHLGNEVVESTYFHGNANLVSALKATGYDKNATASTIIFRCYPEDVQRNTEWLLCHGGYSQGFQNNHVRIYCNAMGGEAVNPADKKQPVTANTWIDIAFIHSPKTVEVNGENVVTGNMHVVCTYPGVGVDAAPYRLSDDNIVKAIPNFSSTANLGSETLVTTSRTSSYDTLKPKFYIGDISRVMVWNRALTDAEVVEVFKLPDSPGADADGRYVIGAMNGSANEFGGTAGNVSLNLDTAEWRAFPSAIRSGDAWTLTYTLAEGGVKSRNLHFKTVTGGATYSVALNGGEAQTVTADATGLAIAFLPSAAQQVGANTLVVTRTDAGESLGLDALELEIGSRSLVRTYTADATVTADEDFEDDTSLTLDVADGKTVTYSGLLSGALAIRKTGAGTLVLANAANTFTGGVTVDGGTVATHTQDAVTAPFGSGFVTVNQDGGARLEISTSLTNDFLFTGVSTRAAPSLHFGAKATLSGAVNAGDLYFSTAWADEPARRDETLVSFTGPVSAATIGGAPHVTVGFSGLVTADVFDAYWTDNSAHVPAALCPTRGNLGRIGFGLRANPITTLKIDQTRIVLWKSDSLYNTTIQFTGEHLADGWGYLDLNNTQQLYLLAADAPAAAVTQGGAQIINTGADEKQIKFKGFFADGMVNVQFEGPMLLEFVIDSGANDLTFAPRRHLCSGVMHLARHSSFENGCTFRHLRRIYSDSGVTVHFEAMEDGALSSVTTMGSSSSFAYYLRAGLFTPLAVSLQLEGKNSITLKTSDSLYLTDGETWKLKGLTYGTGEGDDFQKITAPAGTYSATDNPKAVDSLYQGTLQVFQPCTVSTITYAGDGTSFTEAADWQDANGQPLASAPDFTLPQYDAVIALNGRTLTLPAGETLFNSLQLTGGGTLTGGDTAKLAVMGTFAVDSDIAAGTSYTLNVPLMLYSDTELAIPTNGSFTSNIGISGLASLTLQGRAQSGMVWDNATDSGWSLPQGGEFRLYGTNTFTGSLYSKRGIVHLRGVLGNDDDTSTFHHDCSTGASPYLYGALFYEGVTVNKRVLYSSVGLGTQVSNRNSSVQLAAGTTNVFNRAYKYTSSNTLYLPTDTKTVFNDTYTCENSQAFTTYNNAQNVEVVFNGTVNVPSTEKGYLSLSSSAGTGETVFRFNGPYGVLGRYLALSGRAHVYCGTDRVITPSWYIQMDANSVLDLGAYTFATPSIYAFANSVVTGVEGSCLEVTDASYANGNGTVYNRFYGTLAGAASLKMSGANTLNYKATGLSTGALIAAGGTIAIDGTATFNPEGSLVVENGGILNLPAGKRLTVMRGTLDGMELAHKLYTTAEPGVLAGHLTGGGSVRIGIKPLAIYLR